MLTNVDVKKLNEIFLTKEDIPKIVTATMEAGKYVFVTKEEFQKEFAEFRKDFSQLQTSVDRFAKTVARHDDEIKIINHRLHKLENSA